MPNKKVILCENCNFENVNPTPDEDGDLVCEECGDILPAQVRNCVYWKYYCIDRVMFIYDCIF